MTSRVRRFSRLLLVFLPSLAGLAAPLSAQSLLYWDINGTAPGSGSTAPSGAWNLTQPAWNQADGTGVSTPWISTPPAMAVFAAGTDATGSYQVLLNEGTLLGAGGIRVTQGTVTLAASGPDDGLDFSTANAMLEIAATATLNLRANLHGTAGLGKTGTGLLILDAAQLPSGPYSLVAGETRLATGRQMVATALTLGGGAGASSVLNLDQNSVLSLEGNLTYSSLNAATAAFITGTGSIHLNGSRTVSVQNAASEPVDLSIHTVIADGLSPSDFTKGGAGTLLLTAAQAYTGLTRTSNGHLLVQGNQATLASSSGLFIGPNATVTLGSAEDTSGIHRLGPQTGVTLNGGPAGAASLFYQAPDLADHGLHREEAGMLTIGGEHRSYLTLATVNDGAVELRFQSLQREGNGVALVRGPLPGTAAGTPGSARVLFQTAPEQHAGVIPWLILDPQADGHGSALAVYDEAAGLKPLSSFAAPAGADNGAHVLKSNNGGAAINASSSIGSWTGTGTGTTTLGANVTLEVESGAFLFTASGTLNGGSVHLGRQGIFHLSGGTGITARINSTLGGESGLILSGTGPGNKVLTLTGTNTFTGGVQVYTGILNLLSAGALNENGSNSLTVQSGGTVRLNGNSITISSLSGAGTVNSNSGSSPAMLNINGGGTFTGSLANGTAGTLGLLKTGAETFTLAGNASYTGPTVISEGIVHLNPTGGNPGTNGRLTATESVTILHGAVLRINKGNGTGQSNNPDRLNDAAPVTLAGGTLQFTGSGSNIEYSETTGALHLKPGAAQISTSQAGAQGTLVFRISGLASRETGATLNFTGTGMGLNARNRVEITGLDTGFAGGWATAGNDFAKYSTIADGSLPSITAFTADDYTTTDANDSLTPWDACVHARPSQDQRAAQGINTSLQVQSLNLTAGIDLIQAGGSLDIVSGGLIKQGGGVNGSGAAAISQISGGTLTAGGEALAAELFVRVTGANLNIGSTITDNTAGGSVALVKSGTGTLNLTAASSFTGGLFLNEGSLRVSNSTGSATGSGTVWTAKNTLLGGNGILAPDTGHSICINGTLAPGNHNDTQARNLTLSVSGEGQIAIHGIVLMDLFANDGNGQLNPTGSADLLTIRADRWSSLDWGADSTLQIVTSLDPATFVHGDSWQLFDWSGIAEGPPPEHGFAHYDLPQLSPGLDWDISGLWSSGNITVMVPEPGRGLMLLSASFVLLRRRSRKRL